MKHGKHAIAALICALLPLGSGAALAEIDEVVIARGGRSIAFLPYMVMEDQKLLEKHAQAAGLNGVTTRYQDFAGVAGANTALLSGRTHFISGGLPGLLTIWDKTRKSYEVRGITAVSTMPIYLNTRNPNVKSIGDFSDSDRIAVPAVKVSIAAMTLQIAAMKMFGEENYKRLDHLTVSMGNPDAMAAMLTGDGEITAHFTPPPYALMERADSRVHTVLSSIDVTGPATTIASFTSAKIRKENPKIYSAFVAACKDALDLISRNKRLAAEIYIRATDDKISVGELTKILESPDVKFELPPQNTMIYADFMHKVGRLKTKPQSWKDYFFEDAHHLPGS